MAQVAFPITQFVDPSGNALADGYVLIALSGDAHSPSGQLCARLPTRVSLDTNGSMVSIPQVWQSSSLEPSGLTYRYEAYTADGQLAAGPNYITV